ncbi:MAG: 4-hydroxy-tetrahydrodipicolinate synthase [candidate division NC10 bacterium]|nr:4-hydroxy-tetrahydrodipicolinate synthase [candidate division NC10 bacterium]
MSFIPKGIIPAMVTPFDREEKLNEKALRQLTNYLVDGGVHGLFPVGSQGEFFALEYEEKVRVMEVVKEEARGRIPVYAGTGAITTREAIRLTQAAQSIGIDAVSLITPFFLAPSQDELYDHYVAIAKATRLPILLYNNPGRTGGVNLTVNLVVKLSQVENIVGIKDSSGDMTLTGEYIRRTDRKKFFVLAGRDTMIYSTLCYGGAGSITATGNVCPQLVSEIYNAFLRGDHQKSLQAQYQLAPLRIAFELGSFPVVIKEALEMIGIPAGPSRSPVKGLPAEQKEELRKVLQGMNLVK